MEKRVAVYNNNTGVIETMSSLLAGEGLKMVAVTGRAQLQELLRAQEIQLLLLDDYDPHYHHFRTGCGDRQDHGTECRCG